MSKLDNLVRSKGYKNFMAKLYGIGAAIVILGAMFKIKIGACNIFHGCVHNMLY